MEITIKVRPEGYFLSVNGDERTILELDPRGSMTSRDWQALFGTVSGCVAALLPAGTPINIEIGSLILARDATGTASILPQPVAAPGS